MYIYVHSIKVKIFFLQLTLCKDKDGKVGLRVQSINNGVFVCLVSQNSPAAMAGLRFGDQILSINYVSVAGYSMNQVHELIRNAGTNGIKVAVRDRSERLLRLILFNYKKTEILVQF